MDCGLTDKQREQGIFCRGFECIGCRTFKEPQKITGNLLLMKTVKPKTLDIEKIKSIFEQLRTECNDQIMLFIVDGENHHSVVGSNLDAKDMSFFSKILDRRIMNKIK